MGENPIDESFELLDAIEDYVARAVAPVAKSVVELEAKLAVVEERMLKGFDRGVWKEGETYDKGEWVTHHGSLWIAQAQTSERPPSNTWRLAVKSGRDARER
jgi:hypothetical protein